jgi:cyclase
MPKQNLTTEEDMHFGATPSEFKKAKQLRRRHTDTESILWERLRDKKTGLKFRRQHPINQYIADFYCHEKRLVIEIDGPYHLKTEQPKKDELRTKDLNSMGIRVIRFSDDQILKNIDEVINKMVSIS